MVRLSIESLGFEIHEMIITLVGMSNLGKSYWADRLVCECGFEKIDCDSLVEAKLNALHPNQGFSGIQDVANWMGFPFEPHYTVNSQESMRLEREAMLETIERLISKKPDYPIVVDTCGSVVYSGEDVLASLKKLTTVAHLEASVEHGEQLFERYISEPKPVIWGDNTYSPNPGEEPKDTLLRCYPKLLQSRADRYTTMADYSIPFERHRDPDASLLDIFPCLNVGLDLSTLDHGRDFRTMPKIQGFERS